MLCRSNGHLSYSTSQSLWLTGSLPLCSIKGLSFWPLHAAVDLGNGTRVYALRAGAPTRRVQLTSATRPSRGSNPKKKRAGPTFREAMRSHVRYATVRDDRIAISTTTRRLVNSGTRWWRLAGPSKTRSQTQLGARGLAGL